jgi:5-methyltetrahydrofolate--homocysteine methyltransferase
MDPVNRDLDTSLITTQALMGQDRLCRNFTNAKRTSLDNK